MNILILSHYYPPEIGAPQARLSEMAKVWTQEGHDVHVLTCFPNHPTGIIPDEYLGKNYMEEIVDGVKIFRSWVYATPNKGFFKKILGHLSFMFSSVVQGRKAMKKRDIIVVSSPTFFSVISAYVLSKMYRVPYIFDVRDLWPAVFVDLGVLKNKFIIKALEKTELFLYRKASAVVSVTHSFTKDIENRGIDKQKLFTVTNGVDINFFKPRKKTSKVIKENNLEGKFIVLYIGAHGISHGLSRIIDVANNISKKKLNDVHFLFVGEGAEKAEIEKKAKELNLNNVSFLPGQPKNLVPDFYSAMDVGLVPLKNIPLFDSFIPSKMFEIMAVGKPIVASLSGEAADILKQSKAAFVVNPEDVDAIERKIIELYKYKNIRIKMGRSGRKFVEDNYSRQKLALSYLGIIEDSMGKKRN